MWDFGWEIAHEAVFATPADFPRHVGTLNRGLRARSWGLGFVHSSRTSFCRAVPNPKRYDSQLLHRCIHLPARPPVQRLRRLRRRATPTAAAATTTRSAGSCGARAATERCGPGPAPQQPQRRRSAARCLASASCLPCLRATAGPAAGGSRAAGAEVPTVCTAHPIPHTGAPRVSRISLGLLCAAGTAGQKSTNTGAGVSYNLV